MARQVTERLVLVDSHARGMQARRAMAARGDDTLGVRVETPASLVSGLWELYGDGREIVDDIRRRCLLRVVLDSVDDEYAQLKGMCPFLGDLVRLASGLGAFDTAARRAAAGEDIGVPGLAEGEAFALRMCGLYAERLGELRLIEQGSAAGLLAQRHEEAFPNPLSVTVACRRPLSLQVEELFASSGSNVSVSHLANAADEGLSRLAEGVRLRFAFPSGRYAQAALVSQLLSEGVALPAVVCTTRPLDLARSVAPVLVEKGLSVATNTSVDFTQTVAGRDLWRISRDLRGLDGGQAAPSALKAALADAAASPMSGLPDHEARALDARLRADRAMSVETCVELAASLSPQMAAIVRIASGGACDEDVRLLAKQARASFAADPAQRAAELAAIGALAEAMDVIARLGGGQELSLDVLSETGQNATQVLGGERTARQADVTFATLESASLLERGSFATAVLLNQTSVDYPVSKREDAASTLLEKLGVHVELDSLMLARRTFAGALALAREAVVLSRPLNDADAEPTYPSAMLAELVDCYRDDLAATDDIDNEFALPKELLEGHLSRGEETLYANATARPGASQRGLFVTASSRVPTLVPDDGEPLLSPSSIDAYLACPRKWLLTRKVRTQALDEGFTPLERGTFAHEALERFVGDLRENGVRKLTPDRVPQARDMMREVCGQLASEQLEREPLESHRLVAATQLEEREMSGIADDLAEWPGFEAELLPRYVPTHLEYAIPVDEAVSYGGCRIWGRIDRIDIDVSGHLVVIDYKGGVSDGSYDPGLAGHRVQSLVYAAVAARSLGLQPAGALYVSYGWRHQVRGAFDAYVIDSGDVPGATKASALSSETELTFGELMELTERRVSEAVGRMREGYVDADPASAEACRTCPVAACGGRLS